MWLLIKLWINDKIRIDPLKSFVQLWILWLIVVSLTLIAFVIGLIITFNSNLQSDASYSGFNQFIEIYKVPIGILALIIPFTAFLAITHRSVQAKEQIISSNKQNVFVNYYKHVEEFEKFMRTSISEKSLSFKNLRITHKYLFPYSIQGDYSINKEIIGIIDTQYYAIKSLIIDLSQNNNLTPKEIIIAIYERIEAIYEKINITRAISGRQIVMDGKKVVVSDFSLRGVLADIKKYSEVLINILSFDHFVSIPEELNIVSNLDLTDIPEVPDIVSVPHITAFQPFANQD